ncbi:MAG: methanol dehydrogenase [cytochrome c] subunit [Methylomonas sp.]|nr:methanol dehydrogenase [cytochrome c] subunit [Methylomonas sp.]
MKRLVILSATLVVLGLTGTAKAYDGTKCKEAGNCWEPKPGYPAQVAGSKYDPKHDPNELNKQAQSILEMEARNAKRTEIMAKTGKFVYDVEGQ